ncbi:unnamed protein product [Ambrosiozyma monospora]|uniref:Unnamed protein product n=1 Tax=Ambrosiozyma monospora TaxID=43982 RepID=A0ACB5TYG0_AMBMO|nr:unnamed protein product [Ambrosiozyma monospora]
MTSSTTAQSSTPTQEPPTTTIIEDIITRDQHTRGTTPANINGQSKQSLSYRLWHISKILKSIDFQFGIRVGLGALFIGVFAYWDQTRHLFNRYRGEWALVTYCIIMNKSVGGTNMTVKWRFMGTFIGAWLAYLVWIFFYPNMLVMALSGFIVCIFCFWIILGWKANNAYGRFILLTYNLTVLYSYTMSLRFGDDPDDLDGGGEGGDDPIIGEIAVHRYLGVSCGVIWALIVSMTLFPMSARSRVKRGLSLLFLRLGISWRSGPLNFTYDDDLREYKLIGIKARDRERNRAILSELELLTNQAPMELRLKGPFPKMIYDRILNN